MRFCLSARTVTSLAPFRVFRCWEMAGGESAKRPAISPDDSAPAASISTMRWRVGSDKGLQSCSWRHIFSYLLN